MLELALWSAKMNEAKSLNPNCGGGERPKKRAEVDEFDFKQNCRIGCGADHVIENVLPYLLPANG